MKIQFLSLDLCAIEYSFCVCLCTFSPPYGEVQLGLTVIIIYLWISAIDLYAIS